MWDMAPHGQSAADLSYPQKNPNVTREALPNVSSKISRTLGLTELYLTQTTPSILEPVAV